MADHPLSSGLALCLCPPASSLPCPLISTRSVLSPYIYGHFQDFANIGHVQLVRAATCCLLPIGGEINAH